MPDGRLLYTRWEYVDRSQVDYHHLWAANPDGTAQMIWYGNLHPGIVMIDAKPIPGSDKVVAIFSPGHGQREHAGAVTLVDPSAGPDDTQFARADQPGKPVSRSVGVFGELFPGGVGATLVLLERTRRAAGDLQAARGRREGRHAAARAASADRARSRERGHPRAHSPTEATGRLMLADVYDGRNMAGVQAGRDQEAARARIAADADPLHRRNGPAQLRRHVHARADCRHGPVEPDGSAYLELPALRSFFFVALDENDLSVKRMQSFLTVQPGETTSCVGCHEQRTQTPANRGLHPALAHAPPAEPIEPIADVPDVIDFPRDIQPILDRFASTATATRRRPAAARAPAG